MKGFNNYIIIIRVDLRVTSLTIFFLLSVVLVYISYNSNLITFIIVPTKSYLF